jgi:hypothetical protein
MRAFCPASQEGEPAKSLKLRAVVFRAWVMGEKGRKRRATDAPHGICPSNPEPAPGKNRLHAASFD